MDKFPRTFSHTSREVYMATLQDWWTLLGRASEKVCTLTIDLIVSLALGHSSLIVPLAVFP